MKVSYNSNKNFKLSQKLKTTNDVLTRKKIRIIIIELTELVIKFCERRGKAMNEIKLYENKEIRSAWDNEKEEWYFSVVDVVGVLTESTNPRDYWYRVKKRMSEEEKSELSTFCRQLKLESSDGKKYNTDIAFYWWSKRRINF